MVGVTNSSILDNENRKKTRSRQGNIQPCRETMEPAPACLGVEAAFWLRAGSHAPQP